MNEFVFQNTTKIYFGENQLSNLKDELKVYGTRILLTYGGGSIKKIGLYDKIMNILNAEGFTVFELSGIEPNPRHTTVNKGAQICRKEKIDVILAVGGGSTIDCSKLISVAAFYEGDSWDIVTHKVEVSNALPLITVSTVSASGSEMNMGSVISNMDINDKRGYMNNLMRPKVSFLDPTNTYSVSAYQTASGSVDIMSHIFDKFYFSFQPKLDMVDGIMESILKTVVKYAPIAIKEPNNYDARANLMWAASWALNDFLKSGVKQATSCHSIEHQLSAYYDITHGHGLAIIIPRWLEYLLNEQTAPQIYKFGRNVFGVESGLDDIQGAKKSIEALSNFFFKDLGLTSTLTELGIDDKNFEIMAKTACRGDCIHGFVELYPQDVEKIYRMCL